MLKKVFYNITNIRLHCQNYKGVAIVIKMRKYFFRMLFVSLGFIHKVINVEMDKTCTISIR